MQIINYLIITTIVVFVIDYSGFVSEVKGFISKLLTKGNIIKKDYSLKPFDCSLCMTFWTTLIYTIVVGPFSLYTLFLCVLSAYTASFVKDIIYITKDLWSRLIRLICEKLDI